MVCGHWLTLYVIAPMPPLTRLYSLGTLSLSTVMIACFTFAYEVYMLTLPSSIAFWLCCAPASSNQSVPSRTSPGFAKSAQGVVVSSAYSSAFLYMPVYPKVVY